MHVGGGKALGLENLLRLDTVEFQDVTQENRDVSGLVSQEDAGSWLLSSPRSWPRRSGSRVERRISRA
jgi:hypothetical protein